MKNPKLELWSILQNMTIVTMMVALSTACSEFKLPLGDSGATKSNSETSNGESSKPENTAQTWVSAIQGLDATHTPLMGQGSTPPSTYYGPACTQSVCSQTSSSQVTQLLSSTGGWTSEQLEVCCGCGNGTTNPYDPKDPTGENCKTAYDPFTIEVNSGTPAQVPTCSTIAAQLLADYGAACTVNVEEHDSPTWSNTHPGDAGYVPPYDYTDCMFTCSVGTGQAQGSQANIAQQVQNEYVDLQHAGITEITLTCQNCKSESNCPVNNIDGDAFDLSQLSSSQRYELCAHSTNVIYTPNGQVTCGSGQEYNPLTNTVGYFPGADPSNCVLSNGQPGTPAGSTIIPGPTPPPGTAPSGPSSQFFQATCTPNTSEADSAPLPDNGSYCSTGWYELTGCVCQSVEGLSDAGMGPPDGTYYTGWSCDRTCVDAPNSTTSSTSSTSTTLSSAPESSCKTVAAGPGEYCCNGSWYPYNCN